MNVVMLSVIMLNVVMLSVVTNPIMLSTIMLNVVMLGVVTSPIMLCFVILNDVILSVVAPLSGPIVIFEEKKFYDLRLVRQRPRRKHLGQAGWYHRQGLLQKPSRGQYYKPFYCRDLFCIIIS